MRKWNNILVRMIMVLLFLHALMGSLMMFGVSTVSFAPLSWMLLGCVIVHGMMGIIATFLALESGKASGRWYLRQNAAFWTKRISGIAILLLLIFHINTYTTNVDGKFFLKEFTFCRMLSQILFIAAIFIHLMVSIKSMLIAKGVIKFREKTMDGMLILSMLTIMVTVAVIVYYVQWQI